MCRELRIAFMFTLLVILVAGCCTKNDPKNVLNDYLDKYYHGKSAGAEYELLSSSDKATKSKDEYLNSEPEGKSLMQPLMDKITYKIKEIKVTGGKAKATVDITAPDIGALMGEFMATALANAFSQDTDKDKTTEQMKKLLQSKMKENKIPYKTNTTTYNLVKEKDGWHVFMNWENEYKISSLKLEAETLEKKHKYVEAEAKYAQAQKLNPDDADISMKVSEMNILVRDQKEKQAYMANVIVKNVSIGRSFLDEKGVFGEIKNLGNKSLKEVEITTYCLDSNGKVVFEKPYSAVLVSQYSLFGNAGPLKPNYTRKFGCKLDDAPSDWNGKVTVSVTNIEFE